MTLPYYVIQALFNCPFNFPFLKTELIKHSLSSYDGPGQALNTYYSVSL